MMKPVILLSFILCIAACSKQAWYSGTKASHEIRCMNEASADYKTCMEENQLSYDEYQKAKKEIKTDEK